MMIQDALYQQKIEDYINAEASPSKRSGKEYMSKFLHKISKED
jgi:hypothetical protein